MLRIIILLALTLPNIVLADEFTGYSRLDCLPSLGFTKFDSSIVYTVSEGSSQAQNADRIKNRYDYFKNTSCLLPKGKLEFTFSEAGRDNSDFYLTVKYKGKIILERVYLEVAGYDSYSDKFSLQHLTGYYFDTTSENPVIEALFKYGNSGMYVTIIFDPDKESFNIKELKAAVEKELKTKLNELPNSLK